MRNYTELATLKSHEERFLYLRLEGSIGVDTFGFDRHLNQVFYKSKEWLDIRNHVIARDLGCDLGVEGHEIHNKILVHHMNPITENDILNRGSLLLDPENLITTTHRTHNAIHFGSDIDIYAGMIERKPGDTKLW